MTVGELRELWGERREIVELEEKGELTPEAMKVVWDEFKRKVKAYEEAVKAERDALGHINPYLSPGDARAQGADPYWWTSADAELKEKERLLNLAKYGSWFEGVKLSEVLPGIAKGILTLPFKIVALIAFLIAFGGFLLFFAGASEPIRSLLEAIFGDSVAQGRRDDGSPLLIVAIVLGVTVIGGILLNRFRWKVVQRWLGEEVDRWAVLAAWAGHAAYVAAGVALVAIAGMIADGEDLKRNSDTFDTGFGTGFLGLLLGLGIIAGWGFLRTWWLLRSLQPEQEEVARIAAEAQSGQVSEREAAAGPAAAAPAGIDTKAWREHGEIRPVKPSDQS